MDMHSQKYNPEVPMESSTSDNNSELHKINDQLITMKNIVNKQVIFSLCGQILLFPHDAKWTN